jgi:hypothetical protein
VLPARWDVDSGEEKAWVTAGKVDIHVSHGQGVPRTMEVEEDGVKQLAHQNQWYCLFASLFISVRFSFCFLCYASSVEFFSSYYQVIIIFCFKAGAWVKLCNQNMYVVSNSEVFSSLLYNAKFFIHSTF